MHGGTAHRVFAMLNKANTRADSYGVSHAATRVTSQMLPPKAYSMYIHSICSPCLHCTRRPISQFPSSATRSPRQIELTLRYGVTDLLLRQCRARRLIDMRQSSEVRFMVTQWRLTSFLIRLTETWITNSTTSAELLDSCSFTQAYPFPVEI